MIRKFKLRQLFVVALAVIAVMATSMTKAQAADPYTINATQNDTSFDTTFNGALNGTYLFDVELWNSAGQRVWQQFETRTVASTNAVTITKDVPALANGTYTVRAGLFNSDWSTKYTWVTNAGTVTVGAVYGMHSYTSGNSITTAYTNSFSFNGSYIFDIELWNSSGQRVWQQFETQDVLGKKPVTITKTLPALANGTYSIRGGIFSNDWSTKYLWTDAAGSITVVNGQVTGPTTTSTSSTSTSTSTSTTSTTAPTTTSTSTTSTTAPTTTSTTAATTTSTTAVPVVVEAASYTIGTTVGASSWDTKFNSSVNYNGSYLFDIELWNSSNQRVFQQYETRSVTNTKTVTITKTIPALAPGVYSIRAGLFSPDWLVKYLWTDAAGALTVASAPNNGGGGAGSPTGPSGYSKLVFSDEFNGNALDTSKWETCSPQMNYVNGICYAHDGERQQYTPNALSIVNYPEGGRGLEISATPTNRTWGNTRPNNVPYGSTVYESGVISTGPNRFGQAASGYQPFSYKYGYYETRMKFPKGQGYWPAAWTFGADNVAGYEIDNVEAINNNMNWADMSYHYPGGQSDEWYQTPDMSAGFHTYGVDWQPDHISWYFDGKLARSVFTNTSKIQSKDAYLILNLAVGGDWPGAPDGTTKFPGKMDIDWVRIWTK